MVISRRHFNSCTLYILLWGVYHSQGILYTQGSIISRGLLAAIMLMSIYYVVMVNTNHVRIPTFLKVLNIFLLTLTAYGVAALLDPTPIYFHNILESPVSKLEFLKTTYMSLLPIYALYYFHKNGTLTENVIRMSSILLLVVSTISFINYQNNMMALALSEGSTREEFTNNIAYDFLMLLPMVFFWNKKPLIQYLLAAYIFVFIVMGMKRGAMLIGALCFMLFIYRTWKTSSGKQRLLISILTVLIVVLGVNYVSDFYATSDYFQHRLEQTAKGNSSGRDTTYSSLWNHFLNETSFIKILFGNGAMQTIPIVGNYAHNDWLEILICHGISGIFIYILYFVALIRHWLISKKNALVFSIMGMVILIMFSTTLFSMSYNNLSLSISICLGYCLAQERQPKLI